jgi:hypothetical protein
LIYGSPQGLLETCVFCSGYLPPVISPVLSDSVLKQLTANELGERLLVLTHVGDSDESDRRWRPGDRDVRPDARYWGDPEARAFYRAYLKDEDLAQTALGYSFNEQGFEIDYCCFWEGDAITCFCVSANGELLRGVETWDGKLSNRWRDVVSPEDPSAPVLGLRGLVDAFTALKQAPVVPTYVLSFGDGQSSSPYEQHFRCREDLERCAAALWESESCTPDTKALVDCVYPDLRRERVAEIRNPHLPIKPISSGPRLRPSPLT